MPNDIGSLLAVAVEARVGKLEREMKRASSTTAREFDKIERRSKVASQRLEQNMAKAGAAVRQSLGGLDKALLGGLAAGGFAGISAGVSRLVGDVAQLGDQARRAGVGVEVFQEWKHVADQARIPIDAMSDGLKELNIRADEFAVTGKGSAADAFSRLGMTPAEVQERLKDPSAFLLELIERTRALGNTAAGIRVFDELFGGTGGEKLVTLLAKSQDEIKGTIRQAHDLGLVLSNDLVADAAELDRRFNLVSNTVGTALKSAIVEAATALSDFIEKFQAFDAQSTAGLNARLREIGLKKRDLDNQTIMQQGKLDRGEDLFGINRGALESGIVRARQEITDLIEQEREILTILDSRKPIVTPAAATTPAAPVVPGGGTGTGTSTRVDGYRELLDQVRQFIADQAVEQAALGKTAQEAAKLRYEQDLLTKATSAGIDLSPAQRTEIEQLAGAMATAEQVTRSLTEAQEAGQAAGQFFGEGMTGAFSDIILGASSAQDAIKGLTDQLVRALIQAAFLGTGPLGGLTGGTGMFSGLKLAGGGEVRGSGTSTSDSIPAMLSDGEHVIRASQARKHRALLTAINDGRVGRFADGGAVGRLPLLNGAAIGGAITVAPTINVKVEGGSRGPDADAAMGTSVAKEIEVTVRGLVSDEMRRAARPGNLLNQRSR